MLMIGGSRARPVDDVARYLAMKSSDSSFGNNIDLAF